MLLLHELAIGFEFLVLIAASGQFIYMFNVSQEHATRRLRKRQKCRIFSTKRRRNGQNSAVFSTKRKSGPFLGSDETLEFPVSRTTTRKNSPGIPHEAQIRTCASWQKSGKCAHEAQIWSKIVNCNSRVAASTILVHPSSMLDEGGADVSAEWRDSETTNNFPTMSIHDRISTSHELSFPSAFHFRLLNPPFYRNAKLPIRRKCADLEKTNKIVRRS